MAQSCNRRILSLIQRRCIRKLAKVCRHYKTVCANVIKLLINFRKMSKYPKFPLVI